jgi:hypothetical protein
MSTETYEVYAIHYGHHPNRFANENFIGGDAHEGPMPLDYFVWAIVGEKRRFVVDTGFDTEMAGKRNRNVMRSPGVGLKAIGVDPASVEDVIVTHMHPDHVGGARDVAELTGAEGPVVQRLQRALRRTPNLSVRIDGSFGPATEAAVTEFRAGKLRFVDIVPRCRAVLEQHEFDPNPTLEHALDVLFILHADHEQNCSANTIRGVGSSHVDPYSATAAAIAALYGPLHGGANEEVLRMLMEIGSVQKVPEFIKRVKTGEVKLMGFGHRVYKNYDPRARIIKHIAYEVFDLMGKNPLLEIALECERIALIDDYFVKRKLYPNVDFYTGLIYQSMGFPMTMFPVLFAIPRTSGWISQWEEMLLDPEQKIARPRQIYLGHDTRHYVPIDQRG